MTAPEIPLTITRGITFEFCFLYADDARTYLPIEAMPQISPVRLTVPQHGIPDGWPVWLAGLPAPAELNTVGGARPDTAKRIDADTIELHNVSAYGLRPYAGGGQVVFQTPIDLTGWVCRAQVREKVGGTLLFSWHSDPAESPDGLIGIDGAALTFNIDAATSSAFPWSRGVYDAELIDPSGTIHQMVSQSLVTVISEVTI
jgi:hypothetical protein